MKKTIKYEILQHFLRPRTRVPSKVMSYAWVIGMAAYQDDTSHHICKYLEQSRFSYTVGIVSYAYI